MILPLDSALGIEDAVEGDGRSHVVDHHVGSGASASVIFAQSGGGAYSLDCHRTVIKVVDDVAFTEFYRRRRAGRIAQQCHGLRSCLFAALTEH